MDGARIFNAAVGPGGDASRGAQDGDSVMFCLSKGLSAPVGSMLAGDADFIARARKNRKMVGGGMRQAGVLAAAGIVALETMIDRLADDHGNARALAEALADVAGIEVDLSTVETNMVVFDIGCLGIDSDQFAAELSAEGVRVSTRPPHGMRAVTNRHFRREDVERTVDAIKAVCERHLAPRRHA